MFGCGVCWQCVDGECGAWRCLVVMCVGSVSMVSVVHGGVWLRCVWQCVDGECGAWRCLVVVCVGSVSMVCVVHGGVWL